MPYIGLLPFLRRHLKLVTVVNRSVSMPYIGLLPFLHDEPEDEPTATACVNALHRASPISTTKRLEAIGKLDLCQCPTSGFSHFYINPAQHRIGGYMCQCPTSGFSHFYALPE